MEARCGAAGSAATRPRSLSRRRGRCAWSRPVGWRGRLMGGRVAAAAQRARGCRGHARWVRRVGDDAADAHAALDRHAGAEGEGRAGEDACTAACAP
eukprot:3635987-Pleurochrysis_carterae.AAC.1